MQHFSALAARVAHPLRLPLLLLAALLLLLAGPARAQVDRQLYVTNGQVSAIVRDGGTVYLGGSFTYVGPNNPNGTALNAGTGAPDLRSARPNGTVSAAVSDGAGGWYIGGAFTQVGGLVRNRIAQLDATGAVTGFNPNADAVVTALAVALAGAAAGLALYPNPTRLAATLTGVRPGTLVMVYDALGRAVTSAPADASGTAALALPAGLPAGVYVVRAGSRAIRLTVE